jgi:hypothetical protein
VRDEYIVVNAFEALDRNADVSSDLCSAIRDSILDSSQGVALAARLLLKTRTASEEETLAHLFNTFAGIQPLLTFVFPDQVRRSGLGLRFGEPHLHPDDAELLKRLRDRQQAGSALLSSFVGRYANGLDTAEVATLCLTMIKCYGLGAADTRYLTRAMLESGSTFDYRPLAHKTGRRMIRRYPTGGVSDKVSLILPSILVALSEHVPLMSTTLVARSLSFTGGTWDKMAVIPEFGFAAPGQDIENILAKGHVALCTTNSQVCPADMPPIPGPE